jgi:NADP-dependent aldehyde dehydrogenase
MSTNTTTNPIAVTGRSIIAGEDVAGTQGTHRSVNPATGQPIEPPFLLVGADEVDRAAQAAAAAFDDYRSIPREQRAEFLDAIADGLDAAAPALVERAVEETGLPAARLTGEVARTSGQMRLFAREVRLGAFEGVRHDSELPDRVPAPRPELWSRRIPLGPVVVFGASNFPLAFSTAGGDTASALAAGCPVIVKAHTAHAGTAELAGRVIIEAARATGMPAGVFSLLFGQGSIVGQQLAAHPAIAAIGFTGSRAGGIALMETAARRPVPIPVYAEMSSINPTIFTAAAIEEGGAPLGEGFIASLALGAGQFCTNPGLAFVPSGSDEFVAQLASTVTDKPGQTMLTAGIASAYSSGVDRLRAAGATELAEGVAGTGENAPAPALFQVSADDLADRPELQDEVFGAAAIIVEYADDEALARALNSLGGQLTTTLRISDADIPRMQELLPSLERLAGRILVNGWPTGVEVVDSMVHGGPFPATSDSRATSVGTMAIERFLRPVTYQGFPGQLLPTVFSEQGVPKRDDGQLIGREV